MTATRTDLIKAAVPGVSRAFSPEASEICEQFCIAIADCAGLDDDEEARVYSADLQHHSAVMLQISGRLAALHGN